MRAPNLIINSIAALAVGLTGTTQSAEPEVCVADGKVYSVGAEVCFAGVVLECEQFNWWKYRDTCDFSVPPVSQREVNKAEDVDGSLCLWGGYYSPGYEGCLSGSYQKCEDGGTWREYQAPAGVSCPR